jgi:hypothetical protein
MGDVIVLREVSDSWRWKLFYGNRGAPRDAQEIAGVVARLLHHCSA